MLQIHKNLKSCWGSFNNFSTHASPMSTLASKYAENSRLCRMRPGWDSCLGSLLASDWSLSRNDSRLVADNTVLFGKLER